MIPEQRHKVSRITMSGPEPVKHPEIPNLIAPIRRVRLVTINGQIWDKTFNGFGLTREAIEKDWLTDQPNWTKYEPNTNEKRVPI